MANRFWVGGTGTWNTSSTTNWSATSGGASGASVPTVADNVFFDQAGTYTVTMTGALACLDITVSAGTVTFATGTSPTLNVRGSMSLLAGTVWSSTADITFSSTTTGKTITTNGVTINGQIEFTGIGGGWTLGSNLTSGRLNFLAGTFDTSSANNWSINCGGQFSSSGSQSRTINLNGSTVTVSISTSAAFAFTTSSGLTFNAGMSQINFTGSTSGILTLGLTFYNVAFTNTSVGTKTITGVNTFNNLAVTGPASAGVVTVTFDSQQTINGALSTTGTAGNRRVFFTTDTYGISRDLVVNSAPSLTDADFRGLYVRGTAAPISGTRIGNRGECRGITFSAPKTVYWNLAAGGVWIDNAWATSIGGTVNTDNFPLPQDTGAIVNTGLNTSAIVSTSGATPYLSSVDMSARTNAMTFNVTSTAPTCYGNWTNGSGTTLLTANTITFSGGGTQTITSAGKTFAQPITINTYGGTVQLADALDIGGGNIGLTNGTFTTAGYSVRAGSITTNGTGVKTLNLGASAVTFIGSGVDFSASTNIVVNAGTSSISYTGGGTNFNGGGAQFFNVAFNNTGQSIDVRSSNTFNNLTILPGFAGSILSLTFFGNQTINGTLTCAGASAVQRIFLQSDTSGTTRTLTVNSISAADCDFRNITLAGAASGASPTRAGDCGGNTGITFPAPKTVYWNLAGAQNWSATGWATSSGGSPAVNNFPLAQDTVVFDNTGSAGTITINAVWNIGTFDASLRTSAMTLSTSTLSPVIYGDFKFGTGVTSSSTTGTFIFSKNGAQTITSNGVQFGCNITINHPLANVQLADAISLGATRTLSISSGTFDAVTYSVTVGRFFNDLTANTLKMGSGTWTLSGTGLVWSCASAPTLVAGTSTIVLSDTSVAARTFSGGGRYYNKLTIGGATGSSTLTIGGTNTFGELASTKTVTHQILFPSSTTTTIGKWSVAGTAGNVVSVGPSTGATTYFLTIAGPANSGIDYLSVSFCVVNTTSPGEFYVGASSTNAGSNTRVIFTATPAPRTLYWVGGTGNWSSTTKWSTSSGGAPGADIPTSLDAVIFNSASNATAYTATIDAGVTLARCAAFTMAGPASGNVTFAGTVGIAFHGNVSFAATGITRTYTGAMNWAGNGSYTFTANGLAVGSACTVIGVGSTWELGSAINTTSFTCTFGSFSTSASNYSINPGSGAFASNNNNVRSVSLNNSTVAISAVSSSAFSFGTTTNLTFNAGASQINLIGNTSGISSGGLIFNNVSFTNASNPSITITGANTFNTLSFAAQTNAGISPVTFNADQTIGTLTLNAGTASAYRTFLASNTIGTQRTLNVTTLTAGAADIDFRDIAITGAAAPLTGTRFGDAKGNSGITFPAAKTVYWAQATSGSWGATGAGTWSATNGGAAANTEFPLAQDTAYIPFAVPNNNQTITVNAAYNIGTLDMNERNGSALVTLATSTNAPSIYGNWINGTGTTLSGTGTITFAGRGAQTITSAGRAFAQTFTINTPTGSAAIQDALTVVAVTHTSGTLDANNYNVTFTSGGLGLISSSSNTRTLAIGSGTWTVVSSGGSDWSTNTITGLTITGSGTINMTSASAKTFNGGGANYSGITLNQGGAGALTISGNNTFKDITNTYSATGATSILLQNTTQTLTGPWAATGAAGRVLTVSGTSAASPATLIFSGAGTAADVDYLNISNVRAYDIFNEWYAGANSTNSGSLGWYFVAAGGTVYAATITETGTGTDVVIAGLVYLGTVAELATSSDAFAAAASFRGVVSESGTGSDTISAQSALGGAILESATITDTNLARLVARATLAETATGTDSISAKASFLSAIAEAATITDLISSIKGYFAYIVETATGTDSVVSSYVARSSVNETASGAETVTPRYTARPNVAESASGTETISPSRVTRPSVTESATGAETVTPQYTARPSITETATGTDIVSPQRTTRPNISETATGADSVSAKATFLAAITETATIADLVAAIKGYFAYIAESASASDAVSPQKTTRPNIAESATGTDAVAPQKTTRPSISESATGTDQINAFRSLTALVAEAATVTDALSAKAVFSSILQELAAIADAAAAPGFTYNSFIVELAQLFDLVVAQATFPTVITETATGTETTRAAFIPYANVLESATITDAASALAAFVARTQESANITDAVSPPGSVYNSVVLAVATMLDQVSPAGSVYNATALESATIADSLIGGYLWNLIDNADNANWGVVNTAQTTAWGVVDTTQPADWTLISSAPDPASLWITPDDSQSPNWQNINTLN